MIFSKVVQRIKFRKKLMGNPELAEKLKTLKKALELDTGQLDWHKDKVEEYEARIEAIEDSIEKVQAELEKSDGE